MRRRRRCNVCRRPRRCSAAAASASRSTARRRASSRRWSNPSGRRWTGTRLRRSSGCARRSPAPKACSRTSGSCRTRRRTSSRPSARSSSGTAVSSTLSATDWLEHLSPWPKEFGLERMQALVRELGDPQRAYPSIHVVGTNGKGTATREIEELLTEEGLSVGAYFSPHVRSWSERIRVNGAEADFDRAIDRVREPARRATQFEVLTAAALVEFREQNVDVAVIEAGLGGRWDATNVVGARVVHLTNVSLDHTDVLGETREEIAREKLAVAGPGAIVVLGEPEWARLLPGREVRFGGARETAEAFLGRPVERVVDVALPGRLEWRGPDEVWDGAHNPAGLDWQAGVLPRRDSPIVGSVPAGTAV